MFTLTAFAVALVVIAIVVTPIMLYYWAFNEEEHYDTSDQMR